MHPYLARSRFAPRLSPRGCLTESWAPCDVSGDRVFHDTRERFGGSQLGHALPCLTSESALERFRMRAWAFLPTAPIAIEPLTSLSLLPGEEACLGRRDLLLVKEEGLVTTRDAFRRQGPFLGHRRGSFRHPCVSRGPYLSLSRMRRAAERRYHAVLGLGRSCTVSRWRSPTHQTIDLRGLSERGGFAFAKTLMQSTLLGPRSLVPPLFLKRCVRAYSRPRRCLPTSATATTYGHEPGLSFPRFEKEAMTSSPFLTRHAAPPERKR